ncbi:MAG: hypothetical protein P8Y81_00250, partial [Ignavibacteriaceae bacterium]
GAMVAPGEYTVTLSKEIDGITTNLSEPMKFKVERMYKGALNGANPDVTAGFWRETEKLNRSLSAATKILNSTLTKISLMEKALNRTPAAPGNLDKQLYDLKQALYVIDEKMNGNRSKDEVGEKNNPTVLSRLEIATWGSFGSTYGPTRDQKQSLEIAESEFLELKKELDVILNVKLPAFEKALMEAGAPWVAGQPIPELK